MVSFNSVVLAGNLTRDPELRYTANGAAVCDLRLAVSHIWKGKDGQKHEQVCFVDVVFWNRTAEVAAQFLKKGKPVLVHGRLEYQQWIDKKTNEKRSKHCVCGNAMQFLNGAGPREESGSKRAERTEEPEGVEDEHEPEEATVEGNTPF